MNNKPNKIDPILVLGVVLLALGPALWLAYSRRPIGSAPASPDTVSIFATEVPPPRSSAGGAGAAIVPKPSDAPPGGNTASPAEPVASGLASTGLLSPDGLYVAEVPPRQPQEWSSTPLDARYELVVYRVRDMKEMSRRPFDDFSLEGTKWVGGGAYLVKADGAVQIWSRASLLGQSEKQTPGPDVAEFNSNDVSHRAFVNIDGSGAAYFVPDQRMEGFKFPGSSPVPLNFKWQPKHMKAEVALQPAAAAPGRNAYMAVLSDSWPDPKPTPTPAPTPTPKPLTAAQRRFLVEEERDSERLSAIVAEIDGEEEITDAQKKKLEAEAHALNRRSREGRAKLFPDSLTGQNIASSSGPAQIGKIEFRDLR
ncbi:hypothetical protein EON80_02450, partial [bacterium]